MILLDIRGLTKYFSGLAAVCGVDLQLEAGACQALIGPNGAGKATLLDLIMGQLRVSSGHIRFQGKEIPGLPSHRIARQGIAKTFQKPQLFTQKMNSELIYLETKSFELIRLYESFALYVVVGGSFIAATATILEVVRWRTKGKFALNPSINSLFFVNIALGFANLIAQLVPILAVVLMTLAVWALSILFVGFVRVTTAF